MANNAHQNVDMWREGKCIWPFCCATAPWLLSIILKYFIQESTPLRLRFYYPRHHFAFERINPPLNTGTGWYLAVEFLFKGTKYVCGCREYCKASQVSFISFLIVLVLNYNFGRNKKNLYQYKLCGQRIHDFFVQREDIK